MLQFLFDTDHLTLYQSNHPPLMQRFVLHPAASVGVSGAFEIYRGSARPPYGEPSCDSSVSGLYPRASCN
jgi:hypothetical protein